MESLLLKIARAVLEAVLAKITEQITRIEREVVESVRNNYQDVINGVWVGPDAESFKSEVSSKVIPALERLVGAGSGQIPRMRDGILKAEEAIQQADKRVSDMVATLDGQFRQIF